MSTPVGCYWRHPRVILSLLLVLLCGAALGALVVSLAGRHWHNPKPAAWREGGKEITLARFKQELDLTPEQTAQLEAVLDDFFAYYHTLQAQLDEVRATGKDRILRILNERQRQKFQRMLNELQERQLR